MSIFPGNMVFTPDEYKLGEGQGVISPEGRVYYRLFGRAKLTTTLQTAIPIWIVRDVPGYLQTMKYPPKPFFIPAFAQIHLLDFRLPGTAIAGDSPRYGVDLPRGATLVGTTGENLKVSPTTGTTHTVTAPAIASASNAYTPYAGAVLCRDYAQADQVSPSLITKTGAGGLTLQVTVSNAGNTAAGTGIRINSTDTTAVAFIGVRCVYSLPPDAVTPQNFDLPFPDAPV